MPEKHQVQRFPLSFSMVSMFMRHFRILPRPAHSIASTRLLPCLCRSMSGNTVGSFLSALPLSLSLVSVPECSTAAPFHQEKLPSIQVHTLWQGLPGQRTSWTSICVSTAGTPTPLPATICSKSFMSDSALEDHLLCAHGEPLLLLSPLPGHL